jgi:hypothetical protein
LSYQHGWFEPAVEFKRIAETQGLDYALPTLGTIFSAADVLQDAWWEEFR